MGHGERHAGQKRPFTPLPAQLDLDGRAHDIAPQTERLRLFQPAPVQLEGQTYIDTDERTDHAE
jgi:hypothetical protein